VRIDKLPEAHGVPGKGPSDAEVESFYAENRKLCETPETVEARHILIATTAEDDDTTRSEQQRRAKEIRERLSIRIRSTGPAKGGRARPAVGPSSNGRSGLSTGRMPSRLRSTGRASAPGSGG